FYASCPALERRCGRSLPLTSMRPLRRWTGQCCSAGEDRPAGACAAPCLVSHRPLRTAAGGRHFAAAAGEPLRSSYPLQPSPSHQLPAGAVIGLSPGEGLLVPVSCKVL